MKSCRTWAVLVFLLFHFQSFALEDDSQVARLSCDISNPVAPESGSQDDAAVDKEEGSSGSLLSQAQGEQQAAYLALNAAEQTIFLKNRSIILTSLGRVLGVVKIPLGFSAKIHCRWSSAKTDEEKKAKADLLHQTLKEAGAQAIQKIVTSLDEVLWSKALLISRLNELGAGLEAGVSGGGIVGGWGAFAMVGLGFSVSVNHQDKSVVVELYQNFERVKNALPGYVGVEAYACLLGNGSYHDWEDPLKVETGEGISLPGVTGCMTPKNGRVGLNQALGVGFPATAVFTSSIVRVPLVKLSMSSQWPFWFRAQVLGGDFLMRQLKSSLTLVSQGCAALLKKVSR